MAAFSLGVGGYSQAYSRNLANDNEKYRINDGKDYNETVWVIKRYIPTDFRSTAPVPRYKLTAPEVKSLPEPDPYWIRPREPIPQVFQRDKEEKFTYLSRPSTRCEEWSTLKQMLPSGGAALPSRPPNWGSGCAHPSPMTPAIQRRFPHVNSPMTRLRKQEKEQLQG